MRKLMFAVAMLLTFMALSAKPAHALRCCDDDSSTAVYVGTGSTCAAAQSNLAAQCMAEVVADCGLHNFCTFGITYVDDCYDNPGGGLASKGWEDYGCRYICNPPPV